MGPLAKPIMIASPEPTTTREAYYYASYDDLTTTMAASVWAQQNPAGLYLRRRRASDLNFASPPRTYLGKCGPVGSVRMGAGQA